MVKKIDVEGFDAFMKVVEENNGKEIFALFSGSVDKDGNSWCPDCVVAKPVVMKCVNLAPEGSVFIYCSVGDRQFWKDQNNIFRKNEKLQLKSVPTLLKWGTPNRLGDSECAKEDLVKMLFQED